MVSKRENVRLGWFLCLAVLIHLAAWPLIAPFLTPQEHSAASKRSIRLVSLQTTKRSQTNPQKRQSERLPTKKEEKKKKEKQFEEDWQRKKQVYLPPSIDTEAPKDAEYVSEFNSVAPKETVSRNAQANPKNVLNELSVAKEKAIPRQETGVVAGQKALEHLPTEAKPAKSGQPKAAARLEIPRSSQQDALTLKLDPALGSINNQKGMENRRGNSARLKISDGDTITEQPQPLESTSVGSHGENLNLVPDLAVLARLTGAPDLQLLDENIEEGEGTFLNSAAFKYGSFFRRVRSRIGTFWNPVPELNRRDPTGAVFGRSDRITEVRLTLDRVGKLTNVQVSSPSGLDFLDREAVSALKRAKQFPNLPQDLLSSDDTYTFSFRFHVIRNARGRYQLPF